MSDIIYTLGARDQASPVLDKVGSSLDRLERSTKDLGEHAERSLGKLSIGIGSLVKASGVLFAVDQAMQGLRAALAFVGDSVGGVREAEAATEALSSAMAAAGEKSQEALEANLRLADSLETLTGVESEAVQAAMALAANTGAPIDQLDELARASVGVAEVLGGDLESALTKVRQAQEGNFAAFEKRLPQLKQMTTDEEKLAAVMALASRGIEQSTERYNGTAGAVSRAMKALADFGETIAAAVMPAIDAGTNALAAIATTLTDVFMGAFESSADGIKAWQEFIVEAITSAANRIIAGITLAEVIVTNFGDVWEAVKNVIALKIEMITADVGHLFGTVLPTYGAWFVDNFPRFFVDAFDAITTIINNGANKIASAFGVLWDFISSGGAGGVDNLMANLGESMSGSLLDGFKSSVEALPEITGRAITDMERELQASIGATAGKLAGEFNEKFAARAIGADKSLLQGVGDALSLELNKTVDDAADKLNKSVSQTTASINGGRDAAKSLGGSDAILQAAEGRLITRGPGESRRDPVVVLEQIAHNTAASETAILELQSEFAQLKNQLANNPQINLQGIGP